MQPYFCGQTEDCKVMGSRRALRKAIANVDKWYSVVGILEDMPSTLTVMENRLPLFFRGLSALYNERNSKAYNQQICTFFYVTDVLRLLCFQSPIEIEVCPILNPVQRPKSI